MVDAAKIPIASEGLFIPLDVLRHNIFGYLTHNHTQAIIRIACKAFMDIIKLRRRVLTFQRVKDTARLSKTVQIFEEIRAHRFKKAETFLGLFRAMASQNCSVKTVNLSNCKISRSFLGELIEVMKQCPSLRTLKLMFTKLRPQKAVFLAELLQANTPLTELDLKSNRLAFSGHQTIADALRLNTTLKILHLSGTVEPFEQPTYLEDILANSKSLTYLDLAYSLDKNAVTMPLCRGLLRNNSLKKLSSAVFDITRESTSLLKEVLLKHTKLEELLLGDLGTRSVPVNERPFDHFIDLLSALTTNSTLKQLQFNTDMAEFHAHILNPLAPPNSPTGYITHGSYQFLPQLDSVIGIGPALKVNGRVVDAYLFLGRDTLPALADALCNNSSIRYLDIYCITLKQEGIDRLSSALISNTTIRELTICQSGYLEVHEDDKLDFGPLLRSLASRPTIMGLVCLESIVLKVESTSQGLLELLESNNAITIMLHGNAEFWEKFTKELCARPHLGMKVAPVVRSLYQPLLGTLKQAWASHGQDADYLQLFD